MLAHNTLGPDVGYSVALNLEADPFLMQVLTESLVPALTAGDTDE